MEDKPDFTEVNRLLSLIGPLTIEHSSRSGSVIEIWASTLMSGQREGLQVVRVRWVNSSTAIDRAEWNAPSPQPMTERVIKATTLTLRHSEDFIFRVQAALQGREQRISQDDRLFLAGVMKKNEFWASVRDGGSSKTVSSARKKGKTLTCHRLDMDASELEVLKRSLQEMERACRAKMDQGQGGRYADWADSAAAMRRKIQKKTYVSRCPACNHLLREPPTFCEGCGLAYGVEPSGRYWSGVSRRASWGDVIESDGELQAGKDFRSRFDDPDDQDDPLE